MIAYKVIQIIHKACFYYERKIPKDDTMDLWCDKVKSIPDEAADYISQHITDSDIPPKNYPSVFWALFYAWQKANPEKTARKQDYFECPDCHEGIIYASKRKTEGGIAYKYFFRCCKCRQNHVQEYPKAYKDDLIKHGYEICNPSSGSLTQEEKKKTIETMKKLGVMVSPPEPTV
ncbi:MAG: hypothetical protein A4E53_00624 [Pelotomaculum sp. PtaB.Bin104]|nr:MAG: hypothetical protein A4E53_00624 [Pelotomaculum sp. PtaB.Bin104]